MLAWDRRRSSRHAFFSTCQGTYMFMAPECMQVTPSSSASSPEALSCTSTAGSASSSAYEGHDGRSADVWALGISLYVSCPVPHSLGAPVSSPLSSFTSLCNVNMYAPAAARVWRCPSDCACTCVSTQRYVHACIFSFTPAVFMASQQPVEVRPRALAKKSRKERERRETLLDSGLWAAQEEFLPFS